MIFAGIVLVICAMSSCARVTAESPPYNACGQEVGFPSGMFVARLHPHLTLGVGGATLVVLVKGCSNGAQLSFTPPNLSQYVDQDEAIKAKDGNLVAVVILAPQGASGPVRGFVTVRRNGVSIGTITLTTGGQVTVTPSTGLHDGQQLNVSVTNFEAHTKVDLFECAEGANPTSAGCGTGTPAQTSLVTNNLGAGSTSFLVHDFGYLAPHSLTAPNDRARCAPTCFIAATEGPGRIYGDAAITIAHS